MNYLIVTYKTLFFYFFIFIIYRIMGKREIGQLSIIDLVVSILMAELVAISIENKEESIFLTVIPIIILVILEILSSYLSLKSNKFREILEGKPALIINDGRINFKLMARLRYTLDDLLTSLRSNEIKCIDDIEYAILENNGTLSIFKYNKEKNKTDNPFPLILDGNIQSDTLNYINKDLNWLRNYLESEMIDLEDIFYAFYKENKIYFILKSEINNWHIYIFIYNNTYKWGCFMKKKIVKTKIKINPNIIFTDKDASIITIEVGTN